MKVLYFGNYCEKFFLREHKISFGSSLKWQMNFVENFLKDELLVFTKIPIPIFPKSKYLWVSNKKFERDESSRVKLLNYINLPYIREISIFIKTFILIIINRIRYKKVIALQYNLDFHFSIPLFLLHSCGIVEYVPMVVDLYPNNGFSFKLQKYILKKVKRTIIINECIKEDLCLENTLLIDGGINIEEFKGSRITKESSRQSFTITFTGSIDEINGIDFYIKCIKNISRKDIEFHFYGNGTLTTELVELSKNDERIKCFGFVSNSEILQIQRSSDFLIIPRKKSTDELRYTFPSKLFEYMLSGTPVISTVIPGLSNEYQECIYTVDTEDPIVFANFIEELLETPLVDLMNKGHKAQDFIVREKNWIQQAKKIQQFLFEKEV